MVNHEIDYKIYGEEMQCVEIELDPRESVIAEPGSFMMIVTHSKPIKSPEFMV